MRAINFILYPYGVKFVYLMCNPNNKTDLKKVENCLNKGTIECSDYTKEEIIKYLSKKEMWKNSDAGTIGNFDDPNSDPEIIIVQSVSDKGELDESISTLAHEISHACIYLFEYIGCKISSRTSILCRL